MQSQISKWISLFTLSLLLIGASSCMKDKITRTYTIYTPVLKARTEVLADIGSDQPTAIVNPGKIFLYGAYIFLNELNKGVHIIDNSNPAAPINKYFISIPGNIDIAVKGSTLYADMFTDMLAIDISDPLNVKLTEVERHIFPERTYSNGILVDSNTVITDWTQKDTTVETIDNSSPMPFCRACVFALSDASNKSATIGVAGSMARFSIVNDVLYAVNGYNLYSFQLTDPNHPVLANTTYAGWNIETIYPFKDRLFLGSMGGMFTFNISNPIAPQRTGVFTHATACDPVVANDDYAYVTLRGGNFCQSNVNQLDVIDVKDLSLPKLIKSYPMKNPYGLAIDGNYVFVCDGIDGLKVYDAKDPNGLKLIGHLEGMETYDVIAYNKRLIVVTKNALEQFDYSDINNIRQISRIIKSAN